jgi:hypothetical protein
MPPTPSRLPAAKRPLVILVAAHSIWNVPPLFNVAHELAWKGYRVVVVGYKTDGLPNEEELAPYVKILRLSVHARRLGWSIVRKPLAVAEFIWLARSTIRQLQPSVLITFNDPACLLQVCTGPATRCRRINWLLEFPELERVGLMERFLLRLSSACWERADFLIVPTRERLALHLALRPGCNSQQTQVVQNAPRRQRSTGRLPLSLRTQSALRHLNTLPPGTLRIIYSGAIGNRYGADSLIRAVGTFPTGVHLLMLGAKHPLATQEVEGALRGLPFPDNIHWVDEIPYAELHHVLGACDVGFATYRGDTLNTRFSAPGKLYEYIKSGLVILSDSDCCIRTEAEAVNCGVFFPHPVSEQGIRMALTRLLRSQDKLDQMKSFSRALFENRLCLEKQIAPLVEKLEATWDENLFPVVAYSSSKFHHESPSRPSTT